MNIFKYYKKHISNFKSNIILLMIINIITLSVSLFFTYIIGKYVDLLTIGIEINGIFKYALIILCIGTLDIFLKNVIAYYFAKTQTNMVFKLNFTILQHVKKLPLSYFKDMDVVYLNQRINADTNVVTNFIMSILINLIIQMISFLFITIFLFKQNVIIAIIVLLSIPIYIFLYLKFKHKLYETSYNSKEQQGIFFSHMHDQISNIKFMKINILYEKLDNILTESFPDLLNSILKNTKYRCFFSSIKSMIENCFNVFLFVYAGIQILNDNLTIGSFLIIKNYYSLLLNNISTLVEIIEQYPDTLVSHNRIFDILKLEQEYNGNKAVNIIDSISLDRVCFSYDKQNILNNFSYTFEKGNIYLIKGNNGTGKSTLIDTLLGLHMDRYTGNMYYNNVNIKDLDLYYLRKNVISVLEQEPLLTHFNISENLSEEINNINNQNIEYFIDKLKLNEINEKMKNQKNSEVIVSGGEKQKMALVRTLSKRSEILIMDEPTSALDSRSIDFVKSTLQEIKFNKIIIIISHDNKLNSIADNIIEF